MYGPKFLDVVPKAARISLTYLQPWGWNSKRICDFCISIYLCIFFFLPLIHVNLRKALRPGLIHYVSDH